MYLAADVVLRKLRSLHPDDASGAKKAVDLKDLVIELRRWELRGSFPSACTRACLHASNSWGFFFGQLPASGRGVRRLRIGLIAEWEQYKLCYRIIADSLHAMLSSA